MDFFGKAGSSVKSFFDDVSTEAEEVLETASVVFNSDADLLNSDSKAQMDPRMLRSRGCGGEIRAAEDKLRLKEAIVNALVNQNNCEKNKCLLFNGN